MVSMASKFLSNDQQNFTRMGVACVDEIKLVLKDILETQIAPKDLYNRICLCPELTNGSQRLRPDQKKLCFLSPPSVPDYVKFDVTLLYTLIRNLCQSLKPSQGWGKMPTPTDVQIGDDIERLRLFRNEMFGHLSSSDISDNQFTSQWKDLEIIFKRAQTFVMSQGHVVNYEDKLAFIKRSKFGFEDMDRYKILLEGFLQLFKQTEDFPDIKIRGNNRILCGDKACFEAEIGNCQESTYLRVTWQKLKGNTAEQIDINSEKFKGSTYLRLVVQRVLKEDEGEYQAVVLREVNGRSLVIPSNKIYLQVFGDPPRVKILQITSETEYVAIHYSCAQDVLPSIDQIQWMKNGELLRLNSTKYNGGGVEDKYLKILSPREEDGGEYICTVSNALESVSKCIQLGVPMAQLPESLKNPFGYEVIIEPVIKSCPPVKKVVWQISEDQNSENFKVIDVTHRRYFGSSLDPQKPVLVIPKVSYEDRMYYRIQVSNGIGNSWSNATLLKVDGDIPSVFLNHETNFLEQKVSLLCDVVLTENSPKVAEVLWTKDKKPLDISGCGAKYSGGTVSDPTLIINRVNSNDSGEYQCNVSNAVGNMSSCPIYLAPPYIDVHIPTLENDEEGEKLVCTCTVRSIPEAKAVEWSIQQRPENGFKTIDVHEPTYIGSTVSLPYPVLIVHKYKPASPQIFRIKVTNFIGETTKNIQGSKPHKTEDTFLGCEEVDSRMDFYRKGGSKVMFANLIHDISELFPGNKLKSFKCLLSELVEKDTGSVMEAESIREILQVLRQKNMFCPKDVLILQYLLRKTGCVQLCKKCSNYAKKCKALCFFENQPENGYKHVSFHVDGNIEDYSKEDLLHIQNIVADMLDCSTEFVYIDGLQKSESFVVIVAIKQKYIDKLLARAQTILVRLFDLNVDYLVCDGVKIFRQERKNRIKDENCTENGTPRLSETRFSKAIQCESDVHAIYPGPTTGQTQTVCNYIPMNDPSEKKDKTHHTKIYSDFDVELAPLMDFDEIFSVSSIDFDKFLSSEKSEDPLKVAKDTTNTDKVSFADNYSPAGTTTTDKVLYTRYGNQEVDESVTKKKATGQDTSQSLGNDDVSIKTLKLRQYQLEQADKSLKGENCLIVSPTGSGKTYVAIRIIQHHLEEPGNVKKIVFIVDKNNLANQQSEKIKDYVQCRLKVISGDTQREENFQEMKPLLPQYDVFVVTAQMLVNALTNQGVGIRCFSLLIFDECHHCHGSHPFKQIMNQYMNVKLEQTEEEKQLPQVVGFTASVGVGKAKTIDKATEYLKQVMSNMDAHYLVTVQKHRSDLARHVNSPEQFIKEVPARTKDEFGVRVKSLMVTTEKYLEDTGVAIVDKNAIQPPSLKGNEQYTQWLEDVLLKALAKLSKSEASRSLFTIRKYLEIYNNALVHHSYARATDALNRIKMDIDNLPKSSRNENEIERKIKALFEGEYTKLEACALDHERTAENPLMLKLKEIILTTHAEEPNMRGIVFVRTRILADILASWMDNSKELQRIKARKYTGAQAQTVEGGMTKHEQVNAIELFKDGQFKIIVATTIAEEGLDIRECNLVVRYDYAGNPISLVQARGRGRAENSRFYVLASAEKCVAEREWMNTLKEPMMEEAMKKVQQQIDSNHDAFLLQQQEFQEHAKKERDAAKHNKNRKVVETGQYCLRCLKCNAFLCMSSELRKILNAHHTSISEDFKNSIIGKKYTKAAFCGEDIEMGVGQISCKGCLVKLGTIALFKDVFFPILSITALKIEDDLERGDTLKKWKFVERYFKVPELTTEDLENVAKFGKLIEF